MNGGRHDLASDISSGIRKLCPLSNICNCSSGLTSPSVQEDDIAEKRSQTTGGCIVENIVNVLDLGLDYFVNCQVVLGSIVVDGRVEGLFLQVSGRKRSSRPFATRLRTMFFMTG